MPKAAHFARQQSFPRMGPYALRLGCSGRWLSASFLGEEYCILTAYFSKTRCAYPSFGDVMELSDLGFDGWFSSQMGDLHEEVTGIARISAVDRGGYLIRNESREVPAELAGKFSYRIERSVDIPVSAIGSRRNTTTIILQQSSITCFHERRSCAAKPQATRSISR